MELMVILSFLAVAVLLTLMPGPDILFVIAQSISQNKQAGISTALGLCTGLLLHIIAATLGISAMIYQSALTFSIVKYAGAVYLLYLAWQSFKDRNSNLFIGKPTFNHYRSLYKKGILMNILNPKVSLFFLALLPQFIDKNNGPVSLQMLILGILFMLQAFVIFSLVSIFAHKVRDILVNRPLLANNINLIKGAILCFIGLQIAFSQK